MMGRKPLKVTTSQIYIMEVTPAGWGMMTVVWKLFQRPMSFAMPHPGCPISYSTVVETPWQGHQRKPNLEDLAEHQEARTHRFLSWERSPSSWGLLCAQINHHGKGEYGYLAPPILGMFCSSSAWVAGKASNYSNTCKNTKSSQQHEVNKCP